MPRKVDFQKPVVIAGIATRTTNAREMDPGTAALSGLWGRFYAEAPMSDESSRSKPVYSVYTEYESDFNGAYTVVIGREGADKSKAQKVVTIAAGPYLEFISSGAMPGAVIDGWKQVWSYFADTKAHSRRAYTTDFEYYDPAEPSTVRIYIAVSR